MNWLGRGSIPLHFVWLYIQHQHRLKICTYILQFFFLSNSMHARAFILSSLSCNTYIEQWKRISFSISQSVSVFYLRKWIEQNETIFVSIATIVIDVVLFTVIHGKYDSRAEDLLVFNSSFLFFFFLFPILNDNENTIKHRICICLFDKRKK